MANTITTADRIINRTPPRDPNDKSEGNADNIMLILDGIVNKNYNPIQYVLALGGAPESINMTKKTLNPIVILNGQVQFGGSEAADFVVNAAGDPYVLEIDTDAGDKVIIIN